jgi:hypothetical protein
VFRSEKPKYLAVPFGNEKTRRGEGQILLAHFHFKTASRSFRAIIESKTQNRNVKIQT